ncbi:hypothetical protein JW916_08840 [Candidatus Sumerlaeota bacterium]|nr:hypothetical protein [Candidatus Sumerlaeota bacterium]
MTEQEDKKRFRSLLTLSVGLAGAVVIWVTVPYVNYIIGLQNMSDSYLPAASVLSILLLVLVVNPLMALVAPRRRFSFSETAWIAAIWLCAGVIPGTGLLQTLPYAISDIPRQTSGNREMADIFAKMNLPSVLFPDSLQFGARLPVVESFSTALLPGETIPWSGWLAPLCAWGVWLLFLWTMMAGLVLILTPQWVKRERLSFPLLKLQQSLIESPAPGRLLPPVFSRPSFWIAAIVIFVMRVLEGSNNYWPDMVPSIPLSWNVQRLFTEGILQHLHDAIYSGHIYFILIGMAFFMPARIGFSIWFFTWVYALYIAIGTAYFPPFRKETIYDQRLGAMIAMSLGVLWLGRMQWAHVVRCMVSRGLVSEEDRRDRWAGYAFFLGCAGMFAWLVWAKVQPGWALFYVAFGAMVIMLMARFVAETGLPVVSFDLRYHIMLVKLAPISWLTAPTLFFSGVMAMFLSARVMFATMAMHALGLDPTLGPRRQRRFLAAMVGILLIGVVVSGAAHLYYGYNNSMSLDGKFMPVNPKGRGQVFSTARDDLKSYEHGTIIRPLYNQWKHLAIGAGGAGLLQWACIAMPRWPLHPIGLVIVKSSYSDWAWPSLFIGWLLKILILRYGGARLYRGMIPLVLGIMIGEIVAALFWSLVPTTLALMGKQYVAVNVLPT